MPPFNCEKYKHSNPDKECNCSECESDAKALAEVRAVISNQKD